MNMPMSKRTNKGSKGFGHTNIGNPSVLNIIEANIFNPFLIHMSRKLVIGVAKNKKLHFLSTNGSS